MKRIVERLAVVLALMLALPVGQAAPITYRIVPRFPTGPVVLTGTLTTDGTIGALAAQDILAWSFLLQDTFDSRSATLSNETGTVTVVGPVLVATTSELTFRFDEQTIGFAAHFDGPRHPPTGLDYWLMLSRVDVRGPNIDPFPGAENIGSETGYTDNLFRNSPAVIGVAIPTIVPEPPALVILATGLALLATAKVRFRATRSASKR